MIDGGWVFSRKLKVRFAVEGLRRQVGNFSHAPLEQVERLF